MQLHISHQGVLPLRHVHWGGVLEMLFSMFNGLGLNGTTRTLYVTTRLWSRRDMVSSRIGHPPGRTWPRHRTIVISSGLIPTRDDGNSSLLGHLIMKSSTLRSMSLQGIAYSYWDDFCLVSSSEEVLIPNTPPLFYGTIDIDLWWFIITSMAMAIYILHVSDVYFSGFTHPAY